MVTFSRMALLLLIPVITLDNLIIALSHKKEPFDSYMYFSYHSTYFLSVVVTTRFFDRFILLFIYVCYMCSYVIVCLYVYLWLGIVEFVLEGILVILGSGVFWSFYE
jgi:hypothetical protein